MLSKQWTFHRSSVNDDYIADFDGCQYKIDDLRHLLDKIVDLYGDNVYIDCDVEYNNITLTIKKKDKE